MGTVPKSSLCAALLLMASTAAHAEFDCSSSHGGFRVQTSDSWVGRDKLEHFGVSLPFGALGGWLMRDTDHPVIYGGLLGTVPALMKETLDGTCRTDGFSYKDLFADALGAFSGAWIAHWALTYSSSIHGKTVGVRYDDTF